MSAFISLTEAVQMTTDYRNNRESILATAYQGQNILAICETFDKAQVLQLLNETGCEKLRVYYGMDGNGNEGVRGLLQFLTYIRQ